MRLFSIQSEEFWGIISEAFRSGVKDVDNNAVDNLIHRTKEIYGDEQFLYAFTGRYIQGQWPFLFSSLFQSYSTFFSYYKFWDVVNDGAVLMELEVPDDEVMLGEVSCEMKLEILPGEGLCEGVLTHLKEEWVQEVYAIRRFSAPMDKSCINKIVLAPLLCSVNNVMSAIPLTFMTGNRYLGWDEKGIRAEREACEDFYYEYFRKRLAAVSGYYSYERLGLADVNVPLTYIQWFAANFPDGAPSKTAIKKQLAGSPFTIDKAFTDTAASSRDALVGYCEADVLAMQALYEYEETAIDDTVGSVVTTDEETANARTSFFSAIEG